MAAVAIKFKDHECKRRFKEQRQAKTQKIGSWIQETEKKRRNVTSRRKHNFSGERILVVK